MRRPRGQRVHAALLVELLEKVQKAALAAKFGRARKFAAADALIGVNWREKKEREKGKKGKKKRRKRMKKGRKKTKKNEK